MKKYFKVWVQLTKNAFSSYTSNRINSISFSLGKLFRFGFLWLMIVAIFSQTRSFAGYTKYEALLFFLTFNIVDVASQAVFRGIYRFAYDVNRGNFDLVLSKPINALFYVMTRLTDILDLLFLVPITAALVYTIAKLPDAITILALIRFSAFVILAMAINTGIHILTAALCLFTTENENIIWFYRRTTIVATFPPDILSPVWQAIFTFFIPIIIMMAYPAKALLGTLSTHQVVLTLALTAFFFGGSLLIWRLSLKHYASASS